MFCFRNTGHVIILQRIVSFKFRPVHVHIYVRTKIQSFKFPWDLQWENKPYKLKRSIPHNPVQQENPGGGGGGYSTNIYSRRLHPEVQPLTLYIPFFTKKVPLSFNRRKCTVFYIGINNKIECFRRFKAIKCQPFWALLQTQMTDFPTLQYTSTSEIPDPLIYLRPKKARYPFRGEHPRRVQAIIERIPRYKKSPKSRTIIHLFKIIILSPHAVNDRFSFSQIYLIHDARQPCGRGCRFFMIRKQTSEKHCKWKKSPLRLFILQTTGNEDLFILKAIMSKYGWK